jgi:hypothetical protein
MNIMLNDLYRLFRFKKKKKNCREEHKKDDTFELFWKKHICACAFCDYLLIERMVINLLTNKKKNRKINYWMKRIKTINFLIQSPKTIHVLFVFLWDIFVATANSSMKRIKAIHFFIHDFRLNKFVILLQ